MKQKKPVTLESWKVMIRRYQIVAAIGLVLCIVFFWQMSHRPTNEPPAVWAFLGASLGGLMLLGGLFGVALNYFLHMLHKEG